MIHGELTLTPYHHVQIAEVLVVHEGEHPATSGTN
jgi:hypothetical protein